MLTSVLDEVRCTVMAYPDPLLLQVRAQRARCYYSHA